VKHQPVDSFVGAPRSVTAPAAFYRRRERAFYPDWSFHAIKRTFDILMCVLLAPVMIVTSVALLILNPTKNKGPLFYIQTRMGRDCEPFQAIKFRSMTCAETIERGANDPLETDRITRLGDFLRRSRLDEIPQILNVLKGEMSLVGPRPDYIEHAKEYSNTIPGYKERHDVRPGISGFAQTEVGYAEGTDATREKVAADLHYIQFRSLRLEAWIVWRTIYTVLCRGGS
jgi:lipopolysaccharide/colanic/teichoic acid biosynthesis glycosyltransferase